MRRAVVVVLAAMCMAPTAGDVGGCGRTATELDPDDYADARKEEDCDRCRACGIDNARCRRACDPKQPPDIDLPATCKPLRHDGEVCIRALHAASCETFATYVDDVAPAAPSECEFCRITPPPAEPSFASDAGGDR